jgi:hypothetical protein
MVEKCSALSNDVDKRSISLAVRLDVPASEALADHFENLSSVAILAHVELGHELRADPTRVVPLDGDREAAFSVDVACDVAVQPLAHVVMIANASDERKGRLRGRNRGRCQTEVWHRRVEKENRRLPTLPGGCPPSTIGASRLNFSVRNGKRCFPAAVTAETGAASCLTSIWHERAILKGAARLAHPQNSIASTRSVQNQDLEQLVRVR